MTLRGFLVCAALGPLSAFFLAMLLLDQKGARALEESTRLLGKGDFPGAVSQAEVAASASVPFSSTQERGFLLLQSLGRDAELRGQDEAALLTFFAMRRAALSTPLARASESFVDQANEAIARVHANARQMPSQAQLRNNDTLVRESLREGPPPPLRVFASSLSVLSFALSLGWVATQKRLHKGRLAALALATLAMAASFLFP